MLGGTAPQSLRSILYHTYGKHVQFYLNLIHIDIHQLESKSRIDRNASRADSGDSA